MPTEPNSEIEFPVEWSEVGDRDAHFPHYVQIGSCPGILMQGLFQSNFDYSANSASRAGVEEFKEIRDAAEGIRKILSQTAYLIKRDRKQETSEDARFAASILEKLLMRGSIPLPTLGLEREAIKLHNLSDSVEEMNDEDPETGWRSDIFADPVRVLEAMIHRDKFVLDPAFDYQVNRSDPTIGSWAEAMFLNEWVPRELGESAGHWFIPQVPFGALLGSMSNRGGNAPIDSRRVDFLFCHPFTPPLVIEIDGSQHLESTKIDVSRDGTLGNARIEVIRVPTQELENGAGENLTKIRQRLHGVFSKSSPLESDQKLADFAISCTTASKVQLAVAGAVWRGWLRSGRYWIIKIQNACSTSASGIVDLLDMLNAIDVVYGTQVSPRSCSIELDDGSVMDWPSVSSGYEKPETTENTSQEFDCFTITSEIHCGPFHTSRNDYDSDCIIRSAYLPVDLASPPKPALKVRRQAIMEYQEKSTMQDALRLFLRHIFRKREFREGQAQALINVLRHIDTIVLLPTGGGKSIIYQLAGMLMPGVTLVVDPLIALMEDQVEGLQLYGIDRAIAIFFQPDRHVREKQIQLVEMGHFPFVLVSPERLQTPRFREAIKSMAEGNSINLAVIDEAHCVSEWGHDFRPSYLSLANSLRTLPSSDNDAGPPLLGLTGTASRAVLRDMINDLEIDANRSDSLIRPESFDRKEIKFKVIRTFPDDAAAQLKKELRRLPVEYGLPVAEYYKPRARKTNSGIIFVPIVDGPKGIDGVCEQVSSVIQRKTTIYCGKAPRSFQGQDWSQTKRMNARRFKQDQVPTLVATKAYGMGIDKPNIRYTIHYGVPHSLEQYYQEAGRAGRDQQEAYSTLILQELREARSDELLNPDLDVEELRRLHEAAISNLNSRDDITRALYFHLAGFGGTTNETNHVTKLIDQILPKYPGIPINIPFTVSGTSQEKSIYRLYKLGFVKDYTVDFGSKKFQVITDIFDFQKYQDRFLDYVRSVAPGKIGSNRRRVSDIDPDPKNHRQALIELAKVYIEFIYDEIERARRRAIQEVILLARQSKSDADVRTRLLDYLQEGLDHRGIDKLLRHEQVDLNEWIDLVDKIGNPIEAGELRGICIRALESSADHPGLLLVRGVVETMTSDYYWNVASTSIARAIKVGLEKYDITAEQIEDIVQRLFRLTQAIHHDSVTPETKAGRLESALTIALLDLAGKGRTSDYRLTMKIALNHGSYIQSPETRAILGQFRLDQLLHKLEQVWDKRTHDYETITL